MIRPSHSGNPAGIRGFTLLELLAVVAIISLLAALLIPVLKNTMEKAKQVEGMNNMRQVGIAFRSFTGDNDGRLPGRAQTPPEGETQVRKWPADLAPYIASDVDPDHVTKKDLPRFKVYTDPSDPGNVIKQNGGLAGAGISGFVNPLDNGQNNTSFIMNGYNDLGTLEDGSVEIRPNKITNQTETILLGTPKWDGGNNGHFFMDFGEGGGNNYEVLNLKGHQNGSNYVFLDGSARFITEEEYKKDAPASGVRYGDWLWLVDKERVDIIKNPPDDN